uniref:Palmitoyltransferase n=1 Tax=Bursaphelenchus xylophilus TaxID=6326 RepID=A0A1I7SH07_BURXY
MCLSAVGRGFLRVFGGLTNLLSKIRSKSKLYGIHIPLVLFSTLLLAIYVPFVAIPFTFTYNLWYKLVFGSVLHVIAILVISSLFYTILEPYPEHPQHLKVEDDFFYWEKDEKSLYVVEKCDEIGANLRHITAVCGTCGIIKTERAHHCSLCNVCTPRLDHHCVVLDRCIHYGNQKSFILFFFYMLFFIFTYAIANAGLMLYFRNIAIEGHPGHEYNLMLLLGAWISLTSPIYNSYLMIYFGLAHILMGCVS